MPIRENDREMFLCRYHLRYRNRHRLDGFDKIEGPLDPRQTQFPMLEGRQRLGLLVQKHVAFEPTVLRSRSVLVHGISRRLIALVVWDTTLRADIEVESVFIAARTN